MFLSQLWQTGLTPWKGIWKWSSNMSLNQISPLAKAFWWRQVKEALATVIATPMSRSQDLKTGCFNKRLCFWITEGRKWVGSARCFTCNNLFGQVYSQTVAEIYNRDNWLFESMLLCPSRPCKGIALEEQRESSGRSWCARIRDQGICAHPAASKPALLCNPPAHRTNPLHQAEFRPNTTQRREKKKNL